MRTLKNFRIMSMAAIVATTAALFAQAPSSGYLGVEIGASKQGRVGFLKVVEGSPAQNADLRDGDEILFLDGQRVVSAESASQSLAAKGVGKIVELTIVREGSLKKIKVVLGQRPSSARPPVSLKEIPVSQARAVETVTANAPKESAEGAITAEGVGATETDALKDAFRNAVQQVVGLVVDSDVRVKNEAVIRDQVLSYSDGFITTYDTLSRSTDAGVSRVRIRATVEQRSLVQKLEAHQVVSKKTDMRHLFSKAVTELDAVSNATALLKERLREFHKTWSATPGEAQYDKDKKKLIIPVTLQADNKAYSATLIRLEQVLEKIALKKTSRTTSAVQKRADWLDIVFKKPRLVSESGAPPGEGKEYMNGLPKNAVWFWMGGPGEPLRGYAAEVALKELIASLEPAWSLDIKLLDGSGNIVAEEHRDPKDKSFEELRRGGGLNPRFNEGFHEFRPLFYACDENVWWISPYYMSFSHMHALNDGYGGSGEALSLLGASEIGVAFDLPPEKLKDIVDVKIAIKVTDDPPHER